MKKGSELLHDPVVPRHRLAQQGVVADLDRTRLEAIAPLWRAAAPAAVNSVTSRPTGFIPGGPNRPIAAVIELYRRFGGCGPIDSWKVGAWFNAG
jgi:hypothetical protein